MNRLLAALLLSLCFALLSASLNASASPRRPKPQPQPELPSFSYRLKLPAGAADCATHAASVAAIFERAGKVEAPELKNVVGTCQARLPLPDASISYELDVIVISYQAKFNLTPYRAVFGGSSFLDDAIATTGLYPTYADCLAAIDPQGTLFQAETTLPIVGAYCTATTTPFHPGYSLTIESVGHPKKHLRVYSEDRFHYKEDRTEILQAVVDAIVGSKGVIAYRDAVHVFFYEGEHGIRVNVNALGAFRVEDQCVSQLAETQSIHVKAGLKGAQSFCVERNLVGNYQSWTLTSVSVGFSRVHDDFGTGSGRYDTFEECRLDLNRIIERTASSGRPTFGGLCLPSVGLGEGFAAHTFSLL